MGTNIRFTKIQKKNIKIGMNPTETLFTDQQQRYLSTITGDHHPYLPPAPFSQSHIQPFWNLPSFAYSLAASLAAQPQFLLPNDPNHVHHHRQGIRRQRPADSEIQEFSGIESIPAKRSRSTWEQQILDPTQTCHVVDHSQITIPGHHVGSGGAQEHSAEFRETFEQEEDDDKANLHADHCSTNSPVDTPLDDDQSKFGKSEKVIQMTDPLTQIVFEIRASQLSQMLQKNGKLKSKYNANSNEIKKLKEKFCGAKTLSYVTPDDVHMLQNAGV